MHIKYGKNKSLIELNDSIMNKIELAKNRAEIICKGKCVQYPYGDFKGRWGKVRRVGFNEVDGISILITPFSMQNGSIGKLLYNSEHSRMYYKLSDIDIFADYATEDMIKKKRR